MNDKLKLLLRSNLKQVLVFNILVFFLGISTSLYLEERFSSKTAFTKINTNALTNLNIVWENIAKIDGTHAVRVEPQDLFDRFLIYLKSEDIQKEYFFESGAYEWLLRENRGIDNLPDKGFKTFASKLNVLHNKRKSNNYGEFIVNWPNPEEAFKISKGLIDKVNQLVAKEYIGEAQTTLERKIYLLRERAEVELEFQKHVKKDVIELMLYKQKMTMEGKPYNLKNSSVFNSVDSLKHHYLISNNFFNEFNSNPENNRKNIDVFSNIPDGLFSTMINTIQRRINEYNVLKSVDLSQVTAIYLSKSPTINNVRVFPPRTLMVVLFLLFSIILSYIYLIYKFRRLNVVS